MGPVPDDDRFCVYVETPTRMARQYKLEVSNSWLVKKVKKRLVEDFSVMWPRNTLVLIFEGVILNDYRELSYYHIEDQWLIAWSFDPHVPVELSPPETLPTPRLGLGYSSQSRRRALQRNANQAVTVVFRAARACPAQYLAASSMGQRGDTCELVPSSAGVNSSSLVQRSSGRIPGGDDSCITQCQ